MRISKITFILLIALAFISCEEKEGTIIIENNISNTEISSVKWGNYAIANSLLPGQQNSLVIYDEADEFPKVGQVTFTMNTNNKSVYLVTLNEFELSEGTELKISLTDSTRVE
ncbi:MAG: hypothetical protein PF444_08745 [Bacteroidales bacterium]|jgi:hypothetical protein|nr:hypothetical protein [Bacteroidales bacterium]